jgi:L-asparaginase / beta-aspartyl-peptidase
MSEIIIAVHGGAGPYSDFVKENHNKYKEGIDVALHAGYGVLASGGSALQAVEAAVKIMEDNPLFNAGKGSAFTQKAHNLMCASIMDGNTLNSGAAAIVRNVKNPVTLARAIMEKSKHIFLGNDYAFDFAEEMNLEIEPDAYFFTEHQFKKFKKAKFEAEREAGEKLKSISYNEHGTVGAVALDSDGNVAAATSTGGGPYSKDGRIGDSSMIGVGTYANNKTCAVSTTGDGEYAIRGVIAHDVSAYMDYKNASLKKACHFVVHEKQKEIQGHLGLVAIDPKGHIEFAFNSPRMHRGYKSSKKGTYVAVLKDE